MTVLRLGSLFDGIGVFPLAAVRCGIEPVWASEIEKAPISITKRHFPDMAHLGDVTKLDGRDLPPVHIITFGSPCQNLSQIGNRKGLAGEKSSLFFQAIRIIREMREATNGLFPAIAVWENVPYVLQYINDVLKKKIRRSLLFNHSGQFKEESTSCIFKSFPPASCRKRLAGEASAQEVEVGEFFGVNGSCVGIVDFLLSGRVDGAIAGVCIFVDFAMTDTLKSACKV